MNIFDICIALFLIVFFVAGFKTGVIREVVSLIGIIIVFVVSFALKGVIGNLLCTFIPFIKFSGALEGISTMNILIFQIIAFLILFGILLGLYGLVVKLSKFIQKLVNMTIVLLIPSKILGGLVSLLRGYIIVMIILIILVVPFKTSPFFENSTLSSKILYQTPVLSPYVENFIAPVGEVYDLTNKVANQEIDSNTANLTSLDIMLKYKIVSRQQVENLIKLKKLDNIDNYESILSKY